MEEGGSVVLWPPGLLPVRGRDLVAAPSPGRLLPRKQVRGDCSQAFIRGREAHATLPLPQGLAAARTRCSVPLPRPLQPDGWVIHSVASAEPYCVPGPEL